MPSADVLNSDVNCGLQMNSDTTGVSSSENELDIHKKRESESGQENQERKRRKKSRWAQDESDKTYIPGLPTVIPTNLSKEQEEAYVLQLQIEEVSRKLRTGDLGIPANPEERSPSPEPIYSFDGKRMNTREYRTRKRLEEERHQLIGRMIKINPEFKPPADYKPPLTRVSDKVMIPQDIHPDINFVGLLIGPRGNTLKAMEHETGAKIIIRGKGSVKEGKVGRKDGQPLPGENEPLHAYVTANNPEFVKKAVDKIKDIIRQGVEVPEGQNDLRRQQLRELALLNGTLRENDGVRCTNCGAIDHKSWLCPDKPNVTMQVICTICGGAGHIAKDCKKKPGTNYIAADQDKAKIDQEYLSLMAELGEGPIVTNRDDTADKSRTSSSGGLFDRSTSAPRSIMPAPVHLPTPPQLIPNTLPPPPWTPQSGKMPAPTFSLPPPVPQPSQNSQQSANPVSIIPPTWQPPVMPPQPYSFGAAGVPPVNSPLMPTWMTPPAPVAMPSNITNAVSTQNATAVPPVPSSTTSSSNPPLMSNSPAISAWPASTPLPPMPPGWQPPFPFPTAAAPTATTASPLSSFLTAPPPPPPPPPPPC